MSSSVAVVKRLKTLLGVRVSTQMPEEKPDQFVIVSRIGGGAEDWATRNPRFLVECYAKSEITAETLGEKVWELWKTGLRDNDTIIWSAPDNNLARNLDPDPKLHRFQFTANVQVRPPR